VVRDRLRGNVLNLPGAFFLFLGEKDLRDIEFRLMFILQIPSTRVPERSYVANVIFKEFLGLDIEVQQSSPDSLSRLFDSTDRNKGVTFGDNLLSVPDLKWRTPASLPKEPVGMYDVPSSLKQEGLEKLPVIYPSARNLKPERNDISIDFDFFGGCFFLLTQYEERCHDRRDAHQRLSACDSYLGRTNLLDRPLVDEFTKLLAGAILRLWPESRLRKSLFKIVPTHDVDWPFEYQGMSLKRALRRAAGETIRGRSVSRGLSVLTAWSAGRKGDPSLDPFFQALNQMIVDDSRAGLQGIYYFMAGHTDSRFDTNYDLGHPVIRATLRKVHDAGHLIGLHNSYGTLDNIEAFKKEYETLRSVCAEEKISQNKWYVRSHYLRWRTPASFTVRESLGLDIDSTLGFADAPGFRCGTCHEFSTFDLDRRKHLKLVEQPLIAMECSLIDGYQRLTHSNALTQFRRLREECKKVAGNFVFLWHNSRFRTPDDWRVYRALMDLSAATPEQPAL
jgi:hypothetical protein